jgi:glutamate synthase (NADPH/NADH) large chain
LALEGDANDYVGKGLSGGRIVIRPPADTGVMPEESIIVGNTVLYGAIAGECYFRGVAGERFAVRNSGATAVIEGAGDHCCEYMTGGIVVVLGPTGRNFAAGMSGGIAYVLDEDGSFASRCNRAMVALQEMPDWDDGEIHGDLSDMTQFDGQRLLQLISNHANYTGSSRAAHILANWRDYLPKFRKVMPHEFSRALAEMDKARAMQAAV